jgi:hypothetical protein
VLAGTFTGMAKKRVSDAVVVPLVRSSAAPPAAPQAAPGQPPDTERYWEEMQELRAQLERLRPAN